MKVYECPIPESTPLLADCVAPPNSILHNSVHAKIRCLRKGKMACRWVVGIAAMNQRVRVATHIAARTAPTDQHAKPTAKKLSPHTKPKKYMRAASDLEFGSLPVLSFFSHNITCPSDIFVSSCSHLQHHSCSKQYPGSILILYRHSTATITLKSQRLQSG